MKERLFTRDYLLVVGTNFLFYLVYFQLMLWTTTYALDVLHVDVSSAGLAAGLFILAALVSRLLSGHFIDALGRRRLLLAGSGLYAATTALYFVASGPLALDVVRVLNGLAYGVASTAASTIVATIVPLRRQGEGIGYFTLGVTVASALGPFLAIHFTHAGDFMTNPVLCLVVAAIAFGLSFLLDVPAHRMTREERSEMRSWRISTFLEISALPVSVVALLGGVSYSAVLAYVGAYSHSLGLEQAGSVFFLLFALTSVVSRPMTGRLLDEFGGDVVVYPALAFLALSMVLVAMADTGLVLAAGALVLGLGYATITSACHALAVFVSPSPHVGRATATYFVLLDVGVGVGPYTLGLLEPAFGFRAVYWAGAVVALAGVLYYFFAIGRTGVFTRSAMARVRSLRLHEVELPAGTRSGK